MVDNSLDTTQDFSEFLHALRTLEIERLPPDAQVILSGGPSARWYFDWFEGHYKGKIERHIAVEALMPMPPDLPDHVQWMASSLGNLDAVPTGSVDLVFGGEVIEHLWPDDITGFLAGSHRVLRPGGRIALDSPNRRVTEPLAWLHPEHTLEFTVDEIVELLDLAGFDDVTVRGLVLCYDRRRHGYVPIDPIDTPEFDRRERVDVAADNPEDAFVWWAEGIRGPRYPDVDRIHARVRHLFTGFRQRRLQQLNCSAGQVEDVPHEGRFVRAGVGESGMLVHGPHMPLPAGSWCAEFDLSVTGWADHPAEEPVAWIDAVTDWGAVELARIELRSADLARAPSWTRHAVTLTLDRTTMGVDFRLHSAGRLPLLARFAVDVRPAPAHVETSTPSRLARVVAALRARPQLVQVYYRLPQRLRSRIRISSRI